MTDQDNSKILNCKTEGCDGTSANDPYWNNTFSVCKECYDEASHDKTRGLFIKWKAAKDAENKVLQDAQAKGMIIVMCERIKINKKEGMPETMYFCQMGHNFTISQKQFF